MQHVLVGRVAAVGLVLSVTTILAGPRIRIVEPSADELLFGPTRIRVQLDDDLDLRHVAFHLDEYPRPICITLERPHVCPFDAGKDFQGRTIRVRAVGPGGTTLAEDVVETLAFPRPERVVRRTLQVPVVATADRDGSTGIVASEITCSFAGQPCRAVTATKLTERKALPVFLEILVDVSGSVDPNRLELLESLHHVVDAAPVGVQIATTEFAATYSRLGGFTSDHEQIRKAILKLGSGGPRTCLVSAMRRSLGTLQAIPGHRILFVLSDGEENCLRNSKDGLEYQDALYDVISAARAVSIPIYVYSFEDLGQLDQRRSLFAKSYEGVAAETGGRLFGRSNVTDLRGALDDLLEDLESTWLLDLDLPPVARTGWKRRLVLELPEERGVRLRHPEYWEAENREDSLVRMLGSADPRIRLWAVSRVTTDRSVKVLAALVRALGRETAAEIRWQAIAAIQRMSAGMLLHGDLEGQKAAVKAVETLGEVEASLLLPLRPVLRVYPKLDPPGRLSRRIERCNASLP